MKTYKRQKNKGFTILEALVAILILTISVSSLLSLTAGSVSSARYARNEITANYLLQEAIDSIRNSRDTIAFQQKELGLGGWVEFLDRYGYNGGGVGSKCFSSNGCYLAIENFDPKGSGTDVIECGNPCKPLNYNGVGDSNLFYNYIDVPNVDTASPFTRKVNMTVGSNTDEVDIVATVSWMNGLTPKTQTLKVSLLDWLKGM